LRFHSPHSFGTDNRPNVADNQPAKGGKANCTGSGSLAYKAEYLIERSLFRSFFVLCLYEYTIHTQVEKSDVRTRNGVKACQYLSSQNLPMKVIESVFDGYFNPRRCEVRTALKRYRQQFTKGFKILVLF
jgi:hypothetical protein